MRRGNPYSENTAYPTGGNGLPRSLRDLAMTDSERSDDCRKNSGRGTAKRRQRKSSTLSSGAESFNWCSCPPFRFCVPVGMCFFQFFLRSPTVQFSVLSTVSFPAGSFFRLPLFPPGLSFRSAFALASLFHAPLALRAYSFALLPPSVSRFAFALPSVSVSRFALAPPSVSVSRFALAPPSVSVSRFALAPLSVSLPLSLRCRPFLLFRVSPSQAAVIASFPPLSQELVLPLSPSHLHFLPFGISASGLPGLSSLRASPVGPFRRFRPTDPLCLSSHALISGGAFLLSASVPFVPALPCTFPASLPVSPLSLSGLSLRPGLPQLHPTTFAFLPAFALRTHRALSRLTQDFSCAHPVSSLSRLPGISARSSLALCSFPFGLPRLSRFALPLPLGSRLGSYPFGPPRLLLRRVPSPVGPSTAVRHLPSSALASDVSSLRSPSRCPGPGSLSRLLRLRLHPQMTAFPSVSFRYSPALLTDLPFGLSALPPPRFRAAFAPSRPLSKSSLLGFPEHD